MHASCLQMLPNFTQALQSAAARRRNLSSPGISFGFKNPRINPVPIAEPTKARDMDLHARGTIITATTKKSPFQYKHIRIVFHKFAYHLCVIIINSLPMTTQLERSLFQLVCSLHNNDQSAEIGKSQTIIDP
jgi:hypothetical protein